MRKLFSAVAVVGMISTAAFAGDPPAKKPAHEEKKPADATKPTDAKPADGAKATEAKPADAPKTDAKAEAPKKDAKATDKAAAKPVEKK